MADHLISEYHKGTRVRLEVNIIHYTRSTASMCRIRDYVHYVRTIHYRAHTPFYPLSSYLFFTVHP